MTVDNVSAGEIIDPDWGNGVADQLNNLPLVAVHGRVSATSDANGDVTITYGVTFGSTPTVILAPQLGATTQVSVHLPGVPGNSSCDARTTSNNAVRASASCTVHWIALGVLA